MDQQLRIPSVSYLLLFFSYLSALQAVQVPCQAVFNIVLGVHNHIVVICRIFLVKV